MSLRVVGAGLGRTGTFSLKLALEQLLGAPCYHMVEVFKRPQDVPVWRGAAEGEPTDWGSLFADYAAAVDWPPSAFWKELSDAYPDALVVLSVRDAEAWWESASSTIFPTSKSGDPDSDWRKMIDALMGNRFVSDLTDKEACIAAFKRHNALVRETIPAHRLLEWRASEGWEPLCNALGLPVPDMPFPYTNTKEEFITNFTKGGSHP